MAKKLPLDKVYNSRSNAMTALQIANLEATGNEIRVDSKASGSARVVARCGSLFNFQEGQTKGRKCSHRYPGERFHPMRRTRGEQDRAQDP